MVTPFAEQEFGAPDTLDLIYAGTANYAAASSRRRRWVAVNDYDHMRVFLSDVPGSWTEISVAGSGGTGIAIAALDDTTALFVWGELFTGMFYGILRGEHWEQWPFPPWRRSGARPRLRAQPDGSLQLIWATSEPYIGRAFYRADQWSETDSIYSTYPTADPYYSGSPDIGRSGHIHPAMAWSAYNGRTGVETICVVAPDGTTVDEGEFVPDSDRGFLPVVVRDKNGDTWLAWWKYFDGAYWKHTYTKAEPTNLRIEAGEGGPRLRLELSEPAPDSWWSVLRADGDGDFTVLTRIQAGTVAELVWTDSTAQPGGRYRYRIRRDCVDVRYEAFSPTAAWSTSQPSILLLAHGANPAVDEFSIEIVGAAAGPATVRVYDVRGRAVLSLAYESSGLQSRSLSLAVPASSRPGIYFVQVVDALGRRSRLCLRTPHAGSAR